MSDRGPERRCRRVAMCLALPRVVIDPGRFVGANADGRGGENAMPTVRKAQTIQELSDQLSRSMLVIVTDYRGLKVADLQTLRGNLRPAGAEFHVAKNTLTRIA